MTGNEIDTKWLARRPDGVDVLNKNDPDYAEYMVDFEAFVRAMPEEEFLAAVKGVFEGIPVNEQA